LCCYSVQEVGESLDPRLESVLQRRTTMRGNQHVMKINETEVEYNSNFQLFLATPLSNPQFFPEVFNQVTVINFTVTFEGQLVITCNYMFRM
jgi:dynein heavy chain